MLDTTLKQMYDEICPFLEKGNKIKITGCIEVGENPSNNRFISGLELPDDCKTSIETYSVKKNEDGVIRDVLMLVPCAMTLVPLIAKELERRKKLKQEGKK